MTKSEIYPKGIFSKIDKKEASLTGAISSLAGSEISCKRRKVYKKSVNRRRMRRKYQ